MQPPMHIEIWGATKKALSYSQCGGDSSSCPIPPLPNGRLSRVSRGLGRELFTLSSCVYIKICKKSNESEFLITKVFIIFFFKHQCYPFKIVPMGSYTPIIYRDVVPTFGSSEQPLNSSTGMVFSMSVTLSTKFFL